MRAERQAARGIITEHQRVQRDLAMAHQIQRQMLPDVFPDIPGLPLATTTLPARGIGGDFYEVVQLERHRVASYWAMWLARASMPPSRWPG